MDGRYTLVHGDEENPYEWDIFDKQSNCLIAQSTGEAICELLNKLDAENKQLRHDANVLIYSNKKYREENEKLAEANKELMELEIPVDEIEETVTDYQGRVICIYYKGMI